MEIIRKEVLKFSAEEVHAIHLVSGICTGLMREATDLNLKDVAEKTHNWVTTLLNWEEWEE
jgi:hypothetical protein